MNNRGIQNESYCRIEPGIGSNNIAEYVFSESQIAKALSNVIKKANSSRLRIQFTASGMRLSCLDAHENVIQIESSGINAKWYHIKRECEYVINAIPLCIMITQTEKKKDASDFIAFVAREDSTDLSMLTKRKGKIYTENFQAIPNGDDWDRIVNRWSDASHLIEQKDSMPYIFDIDTSEFKTILGKLVKITNVLTLVCMDTGDVEYRYDGESVGGASTLDVRIIKNDISIRTDIAIKSTNQIVGVSQSSGRIEVYIGVDNVIFYYYIGSISAAYVTYNKTDIS